MNIERVTGENFRSYPSFDVTLPLGATAIVGANGAGKSSLIAAIDYALFAGRGEGARYLRRGATDMVVEVTVEHRGEQYLVRRGYSASGGGKPRLEFYRHSPIAFADLTMESIDATSQRIIDTLGVDRETMRASSVLMQGDTAAWTDADPADRKRVLASILGLDVWDRLHARAKGDLSAAEREVGQASADDLKRVTLEQDAATLANEREAIMVDADGYEASLATARATLAGAQAELERARADADKRHAHDTALARVSTASDNLASKRDALARHDEAMREYPTWQATADNLPALEADIARLRERHRAREAASVASISAGEREDQATRDEQAASAALESAQERLRRVQTDDAPTCPTCLQALADDAHATLEARLRATVEEFATAAARSTAAMEAAQAATVEADAALADTDEVDPNDFADVELRIMEARTAAARVEAAGDAGATREALLDETYTAAAALGGAESALAALGEPPNVGSLSEYAVAVTGAEREVESWRALHATATNQAARLEGRAEAVTAQLAPLADAPQRLATARADATLYTNLVEAYSRNGIPALIVEQQAVPALEANANGILEQLGVGMRVELRTQRATKQGNVRETLDIIVHGTAGEAHYGDFSGGERTRLNVALRVALALLLSNRRGADVRTLIVDEPEYLDADGHERLADLLRSLSVERFDRVLLVSHEPAMLDALDQSITVAKDAHGDSSIGATP